MLLNPITNGSVSGSAVINMYSQILGGVLISADGINEVTIVIRKASATGDIIFKQVTKLPAFLIAPIQAAAQLYYNVSGTGGAIQLYEWVS